MIDDRRKEKRVSRSIMRVKGSWSKTMINGSDGTVTHRNGKLGVLRPTLRVP